MSGDKKQLSIKRLAFNPGIIGAIAAILLFVFGVQLPPVVAQPITHLANLNTPLPMLIIGFYLSQANFKKAFSDRDAYLASVFRLLIIPLAAAFAMFFLKLDRTMVIAFTIACSRAFGQRSCINDPALARDNAADSVADLEPLLN